MDSTIEIVGSAMAKLIEAGQLSRLEHEKLYDEILEKNEVYQQLESICGSMGLYLHHSSPYFYVSPIPGFRTFGYSNEELRRAMNYQFRNEDMYTALFITAVIVTEFYPEARREQAISFLRLNNVITIVSERIEALKNQADLENTSYENAYNFEVIVKKWLELPMVRPDKNDPDDIKSRGRTSKIQIVNTTLAFLEEQGLIRIPEGIKQDKFIYITDRFKATVYNIYRMGEAQDNLYQIIDSLRQETNNA